MMGEWRYLSSVQVDDVDNDSLVHGQSLLRKLDDELSQEELLKREKVRLLDYLEQAIRDKQIELKIENEELRQRYIELNKTQAAMVNDGNCPEYRDADSRDAEEGSVAEKIVELDSKIKELLTPATFYPPYPYQYFPKSNYYRFRFPPTGNIPYYPFPGY